MDKLVALKLRPCSQTELKRFGLREIWFTFPISNATEIANEIHKLDKIKSIVYSLEIR